ncbi:MAG: FixH family protein [Bacillus sp. (in: Bacteria)]|nr:FixH family protein [Bacillus sp. (in: firmicutes)]
MKKLIFVFITILLLSIIVSCSNEKERSNDLPKIVEVKLAINPETGEVNQPIIFEAKVTQGNDKVTDADEVRFEIWRANDEKHEKIEIKHAENGIYRLEKSFVQEGTYYFISHVTARDMHNMPKMEFIVGTPSEPENSNTKDTMDEMDME